jgi:hypothetical protein
MSNAYLYYVSRASNSFPRDTLFTRAPILLLDIGAEGSSQKVA